MTLLVASVYSNTQWIELQTRFLAKTTSHFDHAVVLNGGISRSFFPNSIIIAENESQPDRDGYCVDHVEGLKQIVQYSRHHAYDNYLILDSDAFPLRAGWLPQLLEEMEDFSCAAVLRIENFDIFPHPCVFFARRSVIQEEWLDFTPKQSVNLMGDKILDVGSGLPRKKCFPLLRTNYLNIHPLLYGVYHHMFYHHGCGSHDPCFRRRGYMPNELPLDYEAIHKEFISNPDAFIARLTGKNSPVPLL